MLDEHFHKETPKEALLSALAECECGEEPITEILVIYQRKSGKNGSYDSGLTVAQAGWLCELFKAWLVTAQLGVVMGNLKQDLFDHVNFRESEDSDGA